MKVSSLISTAPKRLPGGATVNNLAKVLGTASQGVIIGLGSVSIFNALRGVGVPFPTGNIETISSAAISYKIGGTAGVLGYLLASGALTGLMGSARATGTPSQGAPMREVY